MLRKVASVLVWTFVLYSTLSAMFLLVVIAGYLLKVLTGL